MINRSCVSLLYMHRHPKLYIEMLGLINFETMYRNAEIFYVV